ncbi:hypothetical protein LUZ60_001899 [Juncus effusus]|nr:hypothetical protein LUZ60_001899 [Juncus effusus]
MAETEGVTSVAETSRVDQTQIIPLPLEETAPSADAAEHAEEEKEKENESKEQLETERNGDATEVRAVEDQDSKRKELEGSSVGDESKAKRQKVDSEEADGLDKNEAHESNEEQAPHTKEQIQNGNHSTEENFEQTGEDLSKTNEQQIQNDEFSPTESERHIQNDEFTPTESERQIQNDGFTSTESERQIQNDEVAPAESEYIDPDMTTSRKIEVPSKRVGIIIGKAGDTIRNLQFNSGAKIQIVKDADADPNSSTRAVELIGTTSCINKAERLIKDVLAEADNGGSPALVAKGYAMGSGSEQVEIQIPSEKVGVIIGKGGQMIKDLQSRSGARIQLVQQQASEGEDAKERGVKIGGNRHQIEAAKSMIKDVIAQSGRPQSHHRQGNRQNHGSRGPSSGNNNNWGPPRSNQNYNNYNNQQQRGGNYHSTPHNNYPPNPQQNYANYPPPSRGWDQRGAPMGGPGPYAPPPPQVPQGYGYQAPPAQQVYQQAAPTAQQYYGQQSQTGYQSGFLSGYPYNNMYQQGQQVSGVPAQQHQYPYGPGAPGSDGYSQQYSQQYGQQTGQVGQAGAGYGQAGQMGPPMYNNQAVQGNMSWMGDQASAAGYNNNQAMGGMGQMVYGQAGQTGQTGYGQAIQTSQVSQMPVGQVSGFDQTAMMQPAAQGQVQVGQTPVAGQWQG